VDTDGDSERRNRNIQAVRETMAAINAVDGAALGRHLADDVSYEGPYYNLHVVTKDRLVAMFTGLITRFDALDYQITEVYPALDPDLIIFEVKGDNPVKDSPKRYQNHYIFFAWFRDGKIARWLEFSNPKVYEAATSAP
jgi:ketosteroid isomerase-like protein